MSKSLQSDFLIFLPQSRGDREGKRKGLNSFLKKNSLRQKLCDLGAFAVEIILSNLSWGRSFLPRE
ncbi:hypothetical protein [uncultured Algoriphagus sp.]|uniref:hypothetical protein n=1 Tax=uncultured Algoriphagus sp. TaxID=417365 RepID=UPI0030EC7790